MNFFQIISMMKNNPQQMYQNMMNNNPQFKKFVEDNKGKTPEEIMKANGIDPTLLNSILK